MESWTDERDPALQAALRDAYGDPPEADWEALRGAVMAKAELPLARLRQARRSSPWAVRFRALVPLAAAAGVVGTAFALVHEPEPRMTPADRAQVEQILEESLPDVSELLGSDQLLSAAIGS